MLRFLIPAGLLFTGWSIDIDAMKHDVVKVTPHNFDTVITKHRDWLIGAVLFYTPSSAATKYFEETFNPVSTDLKRMVKLAAMDCTDFPVFCKEKGAKGPYSVVVFPRLPIPNYVINEDKMEKGKLSSHLARQIPSENIKIFSGTDSAAQIDNFISSDTNIPKVLLIHEKKNVPPMLKSMSNEFRKDMKFGSISSSGDNSAHAEAALKRFKAKKYPSLVLVEKGAKKTTIYKGKMDYHSIADWVNLHRETFAKGGGFDENARGPAAEQPKPWLVQAVPEVTKASHNDVCFKGDGLCVIYLKDDKLTPEEETMLGNLKNRYTSHLEGRGATLKWMWMNLAVEIEFKALFGVESSPSVIIFNPHKRLRFAKNDDEGGSEEDIVKLADKVLGGDARFKPVKGQKLPEFATREVGARDEL